MNSGLKVEVGQVRLGQQFVEIFALNITNMMFKIKMFCNFNNIIPDVR